MDFSLPCGVERTTPDHIRSISYLDLNRQDLRTSPAGSRVFKLQASLERDLQTVLKFTIVVVNKSPLPEDSHRLAEP
jgi:hypothetical protein